MALLLACHPNAKQGPPLKEDAFIQGIVQLHLAESAADLQWIDPLFQTDRKALYNQVLQHQKIDTADFQQTLYWYLERPEKMDDIYEKVGQQLEQIQSSTF